MKSVNYKFDFFCCPKDKASILKEKFENFYRNFVYNFIHVVFNQTLEENWIKHYLTIEIKPLLNLIFEDNIGSISLVLEEDCPMKLD